MTYTEQDLKSKFVTNREAHEAIKQQNLKFRFGNFTKQEAEKAHTLIHKFLENNNLKLEDLQNNLHLGTDFPLHELTLYVTANIPFRTYKTVSTHITYLYHPFSHSKFTAEDDLKLIEEVDEKGYLWKSIGLEMDKYRNDCRSRFLRVKGLHKKHLYAKKIIEIVENGIPTTEEEWNSLCEKYNVTRLVLSKKLNEYLRGKMFEENEKQLGNIIICVYVLRYNHNCGLPIRIAEFVEFMKNEMREIFVDTASEDKAEAKSTDINEPKTGELLDNLDLAKIEENKKAEDLITEFKAKISNFLEVDPEYDLNVNIEDQDIFWETIHKYLEIPTEAIVSKFYILKSSHDLKTFSNLLDLIKKLSYEYFLTELKSHFISKIK